MIVFGLVGVWPLLFGDSAVRIWALAIAVAILAVTLIAPRRLGPLNRLWTKFGLRLNRLANPIIMGLIFFLTVTPTALIFRLLGKDPLKLKFDPSADSYWIHRNPPGPSPESMSEQF